MATPAPGINVSVVRGTIAADPQRRELPSGSIAVQFDVAVSTDAGNQRVPVSWLDPPPGFDEVLTADVEVILTGEVRRRFFRVAGSTQSRTEIVVHQLGPCRRKAAVRKALVGVLEQLDAN